MDWWVLLIVPIGAYFLWRHQKSTEAARIAADQLDKDRRLYKRIKSGMREYEWQKGEKQLRAREEGEPLFETAEIVAYNVSQFSEMRVGFYFKDIDEFGLYSAIAGNDHETLENYYRSDRTFKSEQWLRLGE